MRLVSSVLALSLLTGTLLTGALMTGTLASPDRDRDAGRAIADAPGADLAVFTLDPAESALTFEVRKLGFMSEKGRFGTVEATIAATGTQLDHVRMSSVIDVTSIELSSEETRARLLSADWFNAEDYPEARFTCADVTLTGPSTARAHGQLTIRGITRPTTFTISFDSDITTALAEGETLGFAAAGSFSRSAFGMTRMSGLVGDEVQLDFVGRFERTAIASDDIPATEFPG